MRGWFAVAGCLVGLGAGACGSDRPAAVVATDGSEIAHPVDAVADLAARQDAEVAPELAVTDLGQDVTAPVDADGLASDTALDATAAAVEVAVQDASGSGAEATATADAQLDAQPDGQPDTGVEAKADTKAPPVAPAPPTQGGPVAVQVGGASDDGTQWAAWTVAGQGVPLVFGPQGGYHVWVSVCVPATAPAPLPIAVFLTDTASGLQVPPGVLQLKTKLAALPDHPGQLCRLAMPAFVDCACEMADRAVRVRVEINTGSPEKPAISWAEHPIVPVHGKGPCLAPIQACAPFL